MQTLSKSIGSIFISKAKGEPLLSSLALLAEDNIVFVYNEFCPPH